MKLKILLLVTLLSSTIYLFSQKIDIGRYESEQGSILDIKKNNCFEYFKSNYKIEGNQIYAWDFSYQATGKFKKKNNLLFFTSDQLKIKNNSKENGVSLNIKELKAPKNSLPDSISINVIFDSDLLNLYICDTSQEDFEYLGSCVELLENNKLEAFKGSYFIRIYPNLDNPKNRMLKQKTIYFDSERFRKKDTFSDLEINFKFDTEHFNYEYFEEEIFLIDDANIYHEGQEFILQEE